MMHRAARWVVMVSFLSSMGAHLAVIQTVAWARMAVSFSRSCSLNTSLQKTFDGRHPCPLCMKIKKASQEGASLGAPADNRLDGAFVTSVPYVGKMNRVWSLSSVRRSSYDCIILPNCPPPKE